MKSPASGKRKLTGNEDFNGLRQSEKSLPATWYYDNTHYLQELESIFYSSWIYLCHTSSVAEARSFRSFNIGKQGIFLVRDDHGELRGFHNTCRHRGSKLCLESQGKLSHRLIRCPYHQWAYALDGKLVATSSHSEAADFDKADYPLFPVSVQEWRGAIFVSLAEDPPDLEASLVRGGDRIGNWPMPDLAVGHSWNKVMNCNWKTFWENFNECLHCPNVHPELCELVPMYGRRISYYRDVPDWQEYTDRDDPAYAGGLSQGAETWSMDGRAGDFRFSNLTEEEISRGQSYVVSYPSVFIAAHVDYMRTVRVLPLGPEQTEIEVEWLFTPETLTDGDFDHSNITDFGKRVMQQDADASELNQSGMHSRKFQHGVLMPEEYNVKAFQDWVRAQLGEDETAPG